MECLRDREEKWKELSDGGGVLQNPVTDLPRASLMKQAGDFRGWLSLCGLKRASTLLTLLSSGEALVSEPSVDEGCHMTPRMLVPIPVRLCDHSQVAWGFAFLEDNWENELGFGFPRLFPDLSVFLLEDQKIDWVWESGGWNSKMTSPKENSE